MYAPSAKQRRIESASALLTCAAERFQIGMSSAISCCGFEMRRAWSLNAEAADCLPA